MNEFNSTDGAEFTVASTAAAPAAAAAATPATLYVVGAFLAVAGACFFVARRLSLRSNRVALQLSRAGIAPTDGHVSLGMFGELTDALAAQIPESDKERHDFRRLLRSAGLYAPHAARSIYALRFVLLVAPLVLAGIVAVVADSRYTFRILLAGAVVAGGLSVVPRLYVLTLKRRRMAAIRRGLPDALDMLSMCLGGGLSLAHSLDHVARRLTDYPELAEELSILKRQADVGSLDRALADLSSRVELAEMRQLAALLSRSDRLGTQLSGSLMGQSDQLRIARRQAATLRANQAPVKLVFPLMFCFAPAALIILCAPAVLELKEFLHPSADQSAISAAAGEGISTSNLLQTLDELDQSFDAQ